MACQTYQISIGGISLLTCRVGMFLQEAIEPKLHHEPTQPFGRCRCDARLDPRERKRRDCFFIACCGLCFFKRDEPLLKQSGELLIAVF